MGDRSAGQRVRAWHCAGVAPKAPGGGYWGVLPGGAACVVGAAWALRGMGVHEVLTGGAPCRTAGAQCNVVGTGGGGAFARGQCRQGMISDGENVRPPETAWAPSAAPDRHVMPHVPTGASGSGSRYRRAGPVWDERRPVNWTPSPGAPGKQHEDRRPRTCAQSLTVPPSACRGPETCGYLLVGFGWFLLFRGGGPRFPLPGTPLHMSEFAVLTCV